MNKKVTLGIVMVGIGAISLFLGGCKKEEVIVDSRPHVEVQTPELADIEVYTSLIGTVEPKTTATVLPKMSGEVVEINFAAGEHVMEGQVLCRIHSDMLETLEINVNAASIAMQDADKALSRVQALSGTGAVSQMELEQAQSAATGARLQYEAAKKNLDLQTEYTTVLAPISGKVESRGIDLHDTISPSSSVCVISTQGQNMVKFGVTEKVVKNIELGDSLTIEKDGVVYDATVTEVGSMVEPKSGLYQVWGAVQNGDALTTGAKVKLDVIVSQAEQVMTVPLASIYYDNEKPFVYRYQDGIAVQTAVETGTFDDEKIEICGGLSGSDQVITTWSNDLFDGSEVVVDDQKEEQETEVEVE